MQDARKMEFKFNRRSLTYVTFSLILVFLGFGIWHTTHPVSTKITQLSELSSKLDLWFPPGTTLLDGGSVDQTGTAFPDWYVWGIVNMPRNRIAQLFKQATIIPKNQKDIAECRDWIVEAPERLGFSSREWKAASVKNYQVLYYIGKSGSIIVDRGGTSTTVKVYIAFG